MKKVVSSVVAILLVVVMGTNVVAAGWSSKACNIYSDGYVSVSVVGNTDTKSIAGTVYVYENGSFKESFYVSTTSTVLGSGNRISYTSGKTYYAYFSFTITDKSGGTSSSSVTSASRTL